MAVAGMDMGPITRLFSRPPGGEQSKSTDLYLKRVVDLLRQLPLSAWKNLVTLLLVIWLAYTLAKLAWLLLSAGASVEPVDVTQPLPINATLTERSGAFTSSIDVAGLKQLDLFGGAMGGEAVDAPPAPTLEDSAIETRLQLLLNGIIDSSEQSGARAIISDGEQQALYAPGEVLPLGSNVKLVRVLDDRVILDNEGRYESLWLYIDEPISNRAAGGDRAGERRARASAGTRQAAVPGSASSSLGGVIDFSMAKKDGRVIGYKIRPGTDRGLFDKLGLKPNDIVTAVNGVELTSSAQAMEVYKSIRDSTAASMKILRNNKSLSINVDVSQGEG